MRRSFFAALVTLLPASVFACEGMCIVGVTRAFVSNYSEPVHAVLTNIGDEIAQQLLPPSARPSSPLTLVQPILEAFNNASYFGMRTAIFPSYFHGKCQQNGVDPPGCPDPDCPVVCGTPGSLVHFYPTLIEIAFNYTLQALANFTAPGSATYNAVEQAVEQATSGSSRVRAARQISLPDEEPVWKRDDVNSALQEIFARIGALLAQVCGASDIDSTDQNSLSRCSWEAAMKAYILSFK